MFRRDSLLLGKEMQQCYCLGEGKCNSMGETEKDSLYLDHPPIIFMPCVLLSLSRRSVTSIAEAIAEEVSSCEESLAGSTEGELCQTCCCSG